MTTIVAVRKNDRTCIVSDSLVTYGGRRKEVYEKLLSPVSKLFRCDDAVIGFSGANEWEYCLAKFIVSSKIKIGSCRPEVLRAAFSNFMNFLKRTWPFVTISQERFTSFSPCQMVIARPDYLFEVTVEGCLIENKSVIAIGDGRPFAYGAIRALELISENPFHFEDVHYLETNADRAESRDLSHSRKLALDSCTQNAGELAVAGVRAAASWDPYTLGPFYGWNISERGDFDEFFVV
jgi:ATP-dependent protease HslVU (ClpYQ) peptidase subunit